MSEHLIWRKYLAIYVTKFCSEEVKLAGWTPQHSTVCSKPEVRDTVDTLVGGIKSTELHLLPVSTPSDLTTRVKVGNNGRQLYHY